MEDYWSLFLGDRGTGAVYAAPVREGEKCRENKEKPLPTD